MKKVVFTILALIVLFSCKEQEQRTTYEINGTAEGVYNGIRVYLNELGNRGALKPFDTAVVMNENFKFEGAVDHPVMVYFTMNSLQGRMSLMLENSEIDIEVDKTSMANTRVSGSKTHEQFDAYIAQMTEYRKAYRTLNAAVNDARKNNDSTLSSKLLELEKLKATTEDLPFNYMEENPDTFIALEIFEGQSQVKNADEERLVKLFDGFSDELKNSTKGKRMQSLVSKMRIDIEANKNLKIGAMAPEFSGPTPDGRTITLKDLTSKGKVTIIDFWAAWCGPCRRENPNVVRIYNQYHKQGLEIIGVSLDGQTRQKDPKQAWVEAIEKDQLAWHQISSLKYFNDPVARLYNIRSIPATYILDDDGRIAAKNLRGRALEQKVKELLAQ